MISNKNLNPKFSTAVWRNGDKGYGCASNINGFFEMDFSNNTVSFLHFFSDEMPDGKNLYTSIVPYNESLILLPGLADNLMIFNPVQKTFKKIYVRNNVIDLGYFCDKYADAVVKDNFLFLLPERYSYIAKIDLNTLKAEYIDTENMACTWRRNSTSVEGGLLKVPSVDYDNLLVFNIRTGKVNIQSLNSGKKKAYKEENSLTDYSDQEYNFTEGKDIYWDKVFSAYGEKGGIKIGEKTGGITLGDMMNYVQWKKDN